MREILPANGPVTCTTQSVHENRRSRPNQNAIQLVSLFAGAGGLDQGFSSAGFSVRIAFDSDLAATKTYQTNFPDADVHHIDLAEVSALEILQYVRRSVDCTRPVLLLGGPPCQSFSRSNVTPTTNDPRSDLPEKYADLVRELHSAIPVVAFVFENVPELRHYRKNRNRYAQLKWNLRRAGFNMSEHLLNALDFGVPQNRTRLFLVGSSRSRIGRMSIDIPPAEFGVRTVKDAIAGLPEPTYYRRDLGPSDISFHPNHWTMVPRSEKFKRGKETSNVKRRSFKRLHWNEPSPAVAYGHREIHVHPEGHRRLSVYEAMMLQGFPKDFRLKGTLSDQVTQISNAVAPPVAMALAFILSRQLTNRIENSAEWFAQSISGDQV